MFFGVLTIAGLIIWAIIYNTKKSQRSFQSRPQPNFVPRRVTVDNLKKPRENSINHFENTIELAFRRHIKQCLTDTPHQLKHSEIANTLIMDSVANFAQSLKDNLCQKPEINRIYSHKQIESVVNRTQKKVIGEFLFYI